MKKAIFTALTVLMLIIPFCIITGAASKDALPLSSGIKALRGQFKSGTAPKTDGKKLDYVYYSPVGKNDNTKYPLVIFLHGIGHGNYAGSQLEDSDLPYWSCSELQSRFSDGGAFILMPRAREELSEFWGESYIEPLHALIDDFIEQYGDNIDTTRIAISGSSQGGAMVWMMLENYPEYFATAFPLASTTTPTASVIQQASATSIWIIASKKDPIVNYNLATLPVWNNICKYNDNPSNCRLSVLDTVYNPDGSRSSDNHHLAGVITFDMHMLDGSNYKEMTTVNGEGNTVNMTSPNGLIKWISSTHSEFEGNSDSGDVSVNIFTKVFEVLRNLLLQIVHIFQVILGL